MKTGIIIRPIITEKMTALAEKLSQFAFEVDSDANKIEIRKAIAARYPDVTIKAIRTMNVRGKTRSQQSKRGLVRGKTAGYKKAIVLLSEGTIDFFEGV